MPLRCAGLCTGCFWSFRLFDVCVQAPCLAGAVRRRESGPVWQEKVFPVTLEDPEEAPWATNVRRTGRLPSKPAEDSGLCLRRAYRGIIPA